MLLEGIRLSANDKANLPGPPQGLHAARNGNAAPVKLSDWFAAFGNATTEPAATNAYWDTKPQRDPNEYHRMRGGCPTEPAGTSPKCDRHDGRDAGPSN